MTTKRKQLLPKRRVNKDDSDNESSDESDIIPIEELLNITPTPVFNKRKLMPKQAAKMLLVVPSGTGKTTFIMNIIKRMWLDFDKLWLFSKTLHDEDYQALLQNFKDISKRLDIDLSHLVVASDSLKDFPILPTSDILDANGNIDESINPARLVDPKMKHLLVIDDFSKDTYLKSDAFGTFLDTCRHYKVQVILIQHTLTSAPMACNRSKFTQYVLFRGALRGNTKIDYASQELGLGDGITKDCFRHLYKHATVTDHGFLYIDTKNSDMHLRYRQGLTKLFPASMIDIEE